MSTYTLIDTLYYEYLGKVIDTLYYEYLGKVIDTLYYEFSQVRTQCMSM